MKQSSAPGSVMTAVPPDFDAEDLLTEPERIPPDPPYPRKRPLNAMRGIGFIPVCWLARALRSGLVPTPAAYTVATVIAEAADVDGRWCFLYLETMLERCGGILSLSTVKRSLNDLVDAGLVRKLSPERTREFFSADIASGRRWADRLPMVMELMIPAEAFPAPVVEEINHVRAELGEELLTEESRPYPPVVTRGHSDPDPGSERPTDLYPTHLDPNTPVPSVRGTSTTGRARETPDAHDAAKTRHEPSGRALELLSHVPDAALHRPGSDRAALAQAVDRLIAQGLRQRELRPLLADVHALRRPFPALMRRLADLEQARLFLDGRLGAGVHRTGENTWTGAVPLAAWEAGDLFDHPPEFVLDSQGRASQTCPEHPGVRNVPGGACGVCGDPCRSVPEEILHPPAPTADTSPPPAPDPMADDPVRECEIDPVQLRLMKESLEQAGHVRAAPPPQDITPALSPAARKAIGSVRARLARLRPREPE